MRLRSPVFARIQQCSTLGGAPDCHCTFLTFVTRVRAYTDGINDS